MIFLEPKIAPDGDKLCTQAEVNRNLTRSTCHQLDPVPIDRSEAIADRKSTDLWIFNPRVIIESINFLPSGIFYDYF